MKKMISLFAFMFLLPAIARADSCSTLPDCESMGYFLGYNAAFGTDDSRYIFCPYDTDYRKCVDYDCEGMGFTQTDKTEWCKTIVNCLYDSAYTLCDEPKGERCEVVTCPAGIDVNSLITNAIAIDPCTPMSEDCVPGETVYTNWKCRNGYRLMGGRCMRGSCDEGTYATLSMCQSSCNGTCIAIGSTDPRYSDVCKYVCDTNDCPAGTYGSLPACEAVYGSGNCVQQGSCYVENGGTCNSYGACDFSVFRYDTAPENGSIDYTSGSCRMQYHGDISQCPACFQDTDGCYYIDYYKGINCNSGYHQEGDGCVENTTVCNTPDEDCSSFLRDNAGHVYTPGDGTPLPGGGVAWIICTESVNCIPGQTYHAWQCNVGYHYDEGNNYCALN